MQQFDIVENNNQITRPRYPFAIVLQHERVSSAITVIVAPLAVAVSALGATRLHPAIAVSGRKYLLVTEELAAVNRRSLGRIVGSAESFHYAIIAAIDLCFTGV